MHISWYGQSCFKIEAKEATIAIDPYAKLPGRSSLRFKADILLMTHAHPDHAEQGAVMGEPFVIDAPGEYEVGGVAIRGVRTFHDSVDGKERGRNNVYIIEAEGLTLCHFGDFGETEFREGLVEEIGDVDILFVPVGGVTTIDGIVAARLAREIEPRIIIPMHYKITGIPVPLSGIEPFLKEMGIPRAEPIEKLSIKRKDLPEKETKVVALKPV